MITVYKVTELSA